MRIVNGGSLVPVISDWLDLPVLVPNESFAMGDNTDNWAARETGLGVKIS